MIKILFYINTIHGGGAERVIVNLANQFGKAGYDSILVTSFRADGEYFLSKSVRRISLENTELKQSKIKRNIDRILKLRAVCKYEKPDIIISFMSEPNIRALIATFGLPVKKLISVRCDPKREYAGKLRVFLGKFLLSFADGCVFQTKDARRWFPKRLQRKSRIINNAVKPEFFSAVRVPVQYYAVTCGRLEEQKNHKMLIDAFKYVVERYPYAKLFIYGEGTLRNELENYLIGSGLQKNVFLEGVVSNVSKVLSYADVFLLSSDYEGMPNALLEAMAMGIPCISTDCPCGGPRMVIENGENGLLVPLGDAEAMGNAILHLFNDSDLKDTLGKMAKKSAVKFAPDVVYRQWEKYVLKLVNAEIKEP